MMLAVFLFAFASLHAPAANASVAAAPLPIVRAAHRVAPPVTRSAPAPSMGIADQASGSVFVRNVAIGSRVDVYADGTWMGSTIARTRTAHVALRFRLAPGAHLRATIRSAAGSRTVVSPADVQLDYTTYHFDTLRTGWDPYESVLNTADVSASTFGQLWSLTVDGNVYAQPLYLANVTMPDQSVHNVLYVATCNDTLYALDADTGAPLWSRSFIDPSHGIYVVSAGNVSNHNVWPTIGIMGTPVIDRTANAIFLVANIKIIHAGTTTFHHMLHSVALDTGLDNANSPVDIQGSVQMTDGSQAVYSSREHLERPGLLLQNGIVYIALGSHGDHYPTVSRGWVFGYDEATLQQTGVFTTERSPAEEYLATIWMGGFGIAGDQFGNVYFSTGNGAFDADSGGADFGDSVLELTPALALKDWFTPGLIRTLPKKDLGSGGVMLLPDQPGSIPHLAVTVGKTKNLYLMNRDALGGYAPSGPDHVVQTIKNGVGTKIKGVHGGPAYYTGPTGQYIFYAGNQDFLKAFQIVTTPAVHLVLSAESTNIFPGEGGSIPVVSSNGVTAGTGIVWVTTRPDDIHLAPITLRAYDASDVTHMLFEAPAATWVNDDGNPYLTPTVMNGKVYVGGSSTVTAFGLLGPNLFWRRY